MKIAIIGMNTIPNQFTRFVASYGFECCSVQAEREKGSSVKFPSDIDAAIVTKGTLSHNQYWGAKNFYKAKDIHLFEAGLSAAEIKEDFEKHFFVKKKKLVYGKTWSVSIPYLLGLSLRKGQRFENPATITLLLAPYFDSNKPGLATINNSIRSMVENGEIKRRSKGKYIFQGITPKTYGRLKRSGLELPESIILRNEVEGLLPPEPPQLKMDLPKSETPQIEVAQAVTTPLPRSEGDNSFLNLFFESIVKLQESVERQEAQLIKITERLDQLPREWQQTLDQHNHLHQISSSLKELHPEQIKQVNVVLSSMLQFQKLGQSVN